jgi:ornithine cyclodeaminase/alanine dehydrogenase-like protein (mu-crystallin family)
VLQGGEFLAARAAGRVNEDHILGEIGEVLIGRKPGRQSDGDITLYKSLGIPAEDLVCASYLYREAEARNLGTSAPF